MNNMSASRIDAINKSMKDVVVDRMRKSYCMVNAEKFECKYELPVVKTVISNDDAAMLENFYSLVMQPVRHENGTGYHYECEWKESDFFFDWTEERAIETSDEFRLECCTNYMVETHSSSRVLQIRKVAYQPKHRLS